MKEKIIIIITVPLVSQKYRLSPILGDVIWTLILVSMVIESSLASCGSRTPVLWRSDGRCGRSYSLMKSSFPAQCDPESDRPCCSDYGYCGNSSSHCQCSACVDFRKYAKKRSCIFTLKDKAGFLESPNFPNAYPVGLDCCYDITRPTPDFCGVSLLVDNLDVGVGEEEGYCRRDWLSVPSCVPEKGTRICGNETGQYFQYLFQPGASAFRIEFHSGSQNLRRKGFRIRYNLLRRCPGPFQTQSPPISPIPGTGGAPCYTRIIDRKGTINTPFYPGRYPSHLDCIYEFIRTDYKICGIKMQSYRFNMEDPLSTPFGGACTDFFHLPSCGFLCGEVKFTWIAKFQPGATSLKFHFHSNGNDSKPTKNGFLINFEQVTVC